jgi:transglutaminase-like putative cysteine protease
LSQLQQRQQNRPLHERAEDSWMLRILAQSLVVLGILATDTAAETTMALWAIPASIAGASWSWRQRHKSNMAVKFLLAIGMIAALIVFFTSLLAGRELNDTRLALAELLVQVQVLHSFDLPRRKDLGYSMMIGLILLGVACTLSQTMIFGLWLLLFLAIALPVLVLDYRSRLGLSNWQRQPTPSTAKASSRWQGLPLTFGIILSLGLLLFALMPRLPGYQLRSFPMSAPIETQQKFDNEQVINPGYIRGGQGNNRQARGGRGRSPESGAGEMDNTFYYGFGSKINQNLRGKMTEQVVMRVRSQAAGFWRVMAFDRYTGQGWEASRNDQTKTITRMPWSYQFFPTQKVRLNKTKPVVQTYTMVSDLPNVIPALDQPREVYFPTQEIAIDYEDGLRSPVALTEGLTYTVVSDVPYRDRQRLQSAQSQFPDPKRPNPYGEVSPKLQPKLKKLAETLLAQANSPITSDYEKALFLAQALKQRYAVQLDMPFLNEQDDLVEAFFFKYKGGYPDHFSTALTVLLRSIGMSTRLVTGFSPGQFNPFTGYYVVKNTDAHAITEVYLHKYGWFTFDPIPGHALIPPSIEESQTFTVLQKLWQWVAGWLPSPVTGWLAWAFGGLLAALGGTIARFLALFSRGWLGWLTAALVLTVLGFGGWLGWRGWLQWQWQRQLKRLDPVERLYQQLLNLLAQKGFVKQASQTPGEYLQLVDERSANPQATQLLRNLTQSYVGWRYGGQTVELAELQQELRRLQQQEWRSRFRGASVKAKLAKLTLAKLTKWASATIQKKTPG